MNQQTNRLKATPNRLYTAGIDMGSRTTKSVVLNGRQILSSVVLDTGTFSGHTAQKALDLSIRQAGISLGQIQAVVGTGYGRVSLSFVDTTTTELTCHAMGCHFINPSIRTVVDVGGQDSKVIRLDENGHMIDFIMNDKCAAGTGKFLEMVAKILEIDLDAMAGIQEQETEGCTINNTCVVFAETEIISLLANNKKKNHIVTGINLAFSSRIGNMIKRLGIKEQVVFVGGVAKNTGLSNALSDCIRHPFVPLDIDPQITGALGAAVLAKQLKRKKGEKHDV